MGNGGKARIRNRESPERLARSSKAICKRFATQVRTEPHLYLVLGIIHSISLYDLPPRDSIPAETIPSIWLPSVLSVLQPLPPTSPKFRQGLNPAREDTLRHQQGTQ